ncbi:unnamed protein product [Boreogadus saida]
MEDLNRIRSEFVQRVSKPVIQGLLDDLLAQGVFSTEEKASVTQDNRITQDQARCVIDTVIGKGEESSRIMKDCMLRRDRHLCRQLGLIASGAMVGAPSTTPWRRAPECLHLNRIVIS